MKERRIIAAVCDGRGIGYNNDLIWKISADMTHFKELTLGNVVIMGRKTFESIGKPLNCRDNIVVTSKDLNIEGIHCVRSIEDAYRLAEELDGEKVFVIGGSKMYEAAMPYTDYLDITEIAFLPSKVDVYFPEIKVDEFIPIKRTERYFTKDTPPYRFVTYKRKVFPVAS